VVLPEVTITVTVLSFVSFLSRTRCGPAVTFVLTGVWPSGLPSIQTSAYGRMKISSLPALAAADGCAALVAPREDTGRAVGWDASGPAVVRDAGCGLGSGAVGVSRGKPAAVCRAA
jgi:hypothetical protein